MATGVLFYGFCLLTVAATVGDAQRQPSLWGASPFQPSCKSNEVYQQCGCLRTCCNGGQPQNCASQCTSGCFCKDDRVKDKSGNCIPLKDCNKTSGPPTPTCGEGQQYYGCVPTCRDTCETYNIEDMPCLLYCRPGCACKEGWVKRSDGKCVPKSQCNTPTAPPTPTCGEGQQYYGCVPTCRDTCETYNVTNMPCPLYCRSGCACKEGWVKRSDGRCIPKSQCNTPTDTPSACGKDEEYYEDYAPSCTGRCNAYNKRGPFNCPFCKPGCWCRKGLLKRSDGKCVSPSECDATTGTEPLPACGRNEEYYDDCAPSCAGSCDTYGKEAVILCKPCLPGCWCRKGLVKNKEGKCIPFSQCEQHTEECGADEEYTTCGSPCPLTCDSIGRNRQCTAKCVKGCFCKLGLVRNRDGKCVKLEQCKADQCEENEEFKTCGTACEVTCANFGKYQVCTDECVRGCFCKEGFLKDEDGQCVKINECPNHKCGENEEYTGCGSACPLTCENKDKNIFCTLQCVPGCFCIKGFVKNDRGKCIDPRQCPTSGGRNTTPSNPRTRLPRSPKGHCGVNEEYTECGSACAATCSNRGGKSKMCTQQCIKGCFCKKGYIKNDDGECVEPSQCPTNQCGIDEVYQECGTACPRTCASLYSKFQCAEKCVAGCFCRDDLVRDNGKCIDISDCQTQQCSANEEWKKCGSACPATCSNLGKSEMCTEQCVRGCFCMEGFVKNDKGLCVKPTECPSNQCKANEEYQECGTACPRTCGNLRYQIRCINKCVTGCFCKEGFVRDDNGECVEHKECPEQCEANEEYKKCGSACPATCSNLGKSEMCTEQCVRGCFCKEGFVKNDKGVCVEPTECPSHQCKVNEEYKECGTACPRTCGNLLYQIRCIDKCVTGCFCKEEFVRNDNGECVEPKECPAQCAANEEYKTCGSACPATCSNIGKSEVCTEQCVRGCFCKEGFVKNDKGVCVEPTECPSNQCKANEEYQECGTACPRTCGNLRYQIRCINKCVTGCFCKEDFVRNDNGVCVEPKECPIVCDGYNEVVVDCAKPKTCNTCEIRGNCLLKKCDKGCDCKPGFYRNATEICIPESECPGTTIPSDCNKPPEVGPCRARMPRFYYDPKAGKCKSFIYGGCKGNGNNFKSKEECNKKCGGTPPGRPDCDSDPDTGPCRAHMPRFYYDQEAGKCKSFIYGGCKGNGNNFKSEDECNKKCGGTPPGRPDCDSDPDTGPCRAHMPRFYYDQEAGECKSFIYGGCKGNGNNFKTEEECNKKCGSSHHCGVDEKYKSCGPACPASCVNYGKPMSCTDKCVEGCFCKKGLVRNDSGKCVKPEQCPGKTCGVGEEYQECGTACPRTCRNLHIKISCLYKCVEGCFCKDGLVRNDEGKCVNPNECPTETCGENEEFSTCGSACNLTCANKDKAMACTLQCVVGCFCKEGYVRNGEGKCILRDQCPTEQCNGYNEALVDCAKPKWCNTCEIKGNCKLSTCEKGCDCKPTYYRNETGICIPEAQCPGKHHKH